MAQAVILWQRLRDFEQLIRRSNEVLLSLSADMNQLNAGEVDVMQSSLRLVLHDQSNWLRETAARGPHGQ